MTGGTWSAVGRLDAVKWPSASHVDWSGANLRRCDPYLVWWDATAGPSSIEGDSYISVLLELGTEGGEIKFPTYLADLHLEPTHYHHLDPGGTFNYRRYRSYRLPRAELAKLVHLINHPPDAAGPRRFELSLPHRTVVRGQSQQAVLFSAKVRIDNLEGLEAKSQKKSDSGKPTATSARSALPLIGVIDDGCNFATARLRRNGSFAVLSLWDQGFDEKERKRRHEGGARGANRLTMPDPGGAASRAVGETRSGAMSGGELVFKPRTRDRLEDGEVADPDREEATWYSYLGYLYPTPHWTHGGAILDVLSRAAADGRAAEPDAAKGAETPLPENPPEIVFVQFPRRTVEDTSGGSLCAHALDGLHHLLEKAGDRPVVANLSYGTHAGPHDGTSIFELGVRELLDAYENLHVVLPIGNSHLSRTHCHCWISPASTKTFRWKVLADDPTDTFVEFWLPEGAAVEVTLVPPEGPAVTLLEGQAMYWHSPYDDGETTDIDAVHAAVVYPPSVAQGDRGTMVLVALAPTRRMKPFDVQSVFEEKKAWKVENLGLFLFTNGATRTPRRPVHAPHGVWQLSIRNLGEKAVDPHAWIQRDDVAPGSGPATRGYLGRQAYFLDDPETPPDPRSTLNGIAAGDVHDRLYVVGAMRRADKGLSLYSAAGPNRAGFRLEGPDAVVYGDDSIQSPGVSSRGTLSGARVKVGGTSLAAAKFSRLLYEHLCRHKPPGGPIGHVVSEGSDRPRRMAGDAERAAPVLRGWCHRLEP